MSSQDLFDELTELAGLVVYTRVQSTAAAVATEDADWACPIPELPNVELNYYVRSWRSMWSVTVSVRGPSAGHGDNYAGAYELAYRDVTPETVDDEDVCDAWGCTNRLDGDSYDGCGE